MTLKNFRTTLIVPTLNPGDNNWARWIESVNSQDLFFERVLVIDSGSNDNVVALSKEAGFDVVTIDKRDFNHGATRQMAAKHCEESDILIYLTQDAYLSSPTSIPNIVKYFRDDKVGAVCGRQLPHSNANLVARHARAHNYGPNTIIKCHSPDAPCSIKDVFMSNSFAAYRKQSLHDCGGFPSNTIMCEDMYVTAKMLKNGYTVIYASDATCYHSHNYTVSQEFKRYFDIGVFHARESWIRESFGNEGKAGFDYLLSELKYVYENDWKSLPHSVAAIASKYIAFRLGLLEKFLPIEFKKKFSMHSRYWDSQ